MGAPRSVVMAVVAAAESVPELGIDGPPPSQLHGGPRDDRKAQQQLRRGRECDLALPAEQRRACGPGTARRSAHAGRGGRGRARGAREGARGRARARAPLATSARKSIVTAVLMKTRNVKKSRAKTAKKAHVHLLSMPLYARRIKKMFSGGVESSCRGARGGARCSEGQGRAGGGGWGWGGGSGAEAEAARRAVRLSDQDDAEEGARAVADHHQADHGEDGCGTRTQRSCPGAWGGAGLVPELCAGGALHRGGRPSPCPYRRAGWIAAYPCPRTP